MSLYKYLTIDTLKKVIGGSIRFTQPGAFNDPFEMLPELHIPTDFLAKELQISFDVTGQRRSPPIGELNPEFKSDQCSDVNSRNIVSSLNNSIGVLCLSKNNDSLLMWSHYADEYAGAVIEFDDEHEFFQGKIEIDYRSARPIKDISAYISDGEAVPISELCTKSDQWEYESEVRLVRSLNDCKKVSDSGKFPIYVMNIPIACIRSITLGERTSIENQREVWELVKETNISLSLAAISNWGYSFRPELIKFNEPYPKFSPIISPRTAHIFKDYPGELGEISRWTIENHKLSAVANNTV
ncbi:DUF2971 domain-containing protein [Stutzerimonas stutzeri]|uniref:DUF2971 domain-containing protein n=1 Tax=Stutzerimonas TaxID=2901164 RepID=UPI001BB05129|nr:DUF2971 domain-containing protein [Stutzerimonas stutzeri]QUE76813.1 DUF2971 domain-containing protein [Stutzerimonas stutzeri]